MNSLLALRVPLQWCGALVDGGACADNAPLLVFFEDCPSCIQGRDINPCMGHGVCERHAGETRCGTRRSYVDGSLLVVNRITTNPNGWQTL